jgi:prepilin-type N-terminal cleavage/methylation domain-containing protein
LNARRGYTLLEVVVAMAIALLLAAALYISLEVELKSIQSGRDVVAEAQLARGLLNRIAADVRACLAMPPKTSTGSGTGQSSPTPGQTPTEETGETPAPAPASSGNSYPGLSGGPNDVTLHISMIPLTGQADLIANDRCDLRQVHYVWDSTALVLTRQETALTQAAVNPEAAVDETTMEPVLTAGHVLAREVTRLVFEYYDGQAQAWVPTWEGTSVGPPLAVRITLEFEPPTESIFVSRRRIGYVRVVAVPGAVIPEQAMATTPETASVVP